MQGFFAAMATEFFTPELQDALAWPVAGAMRDSIAPERRELRRLAFLSAAVFAKG